MADIKAYEVKDLDLYTLNRVKEMYLDSTVAGFSHWLESWLEELNDRAEISNSEPNSKALTSR